MSVGVSGFVASQYLPAAIHIPLIGCGEAMANYGSHLSFIETIATQSPDHILFKLPQLSESSETSRFDGFAEHAIVGWKNITYKQFLDDVERLARYWFKVLGCSDGSIVGLWMAGMSYTDTVHLFSLMRAGFVPHALHLDFQAVDTVVDLFTETQVSAIICAPSAPTASLKDRFKIHTIMDLDKLLDIFLDDVQLPSIQKQGSGSDIVMIYNTTGSTSGRPKVVKLTRQWVDTNARKDVPSVRDGEEVALRVGSFSHMGQVIISLGQIKNAACIVLTPWINFTPDELVQIIKECKINVIHQFAAILTRLLKAATTNSELASALQSLKFIIHGGSSIGEKESKWAMEHGIPLKNLFGLTETGMLMVSKEDNAVFYPLQLPGLRYEFWPVDGTEDGLTRARLLELVVLRESLDCPHPSSCDPVGGYYRSKDLFEEIHPGGYKYRGRLDDMIKMENARSCDTKYIEDQVSNSCKNLISCCVVVGSGRPSPVLLVEPFSDTMDVALLKRDIGERVKLINEDSYFHERIEPSHILVVQRGRLPRTLKNNISRPAAEKVFEKDIDGFFAERWER